MLHTKPSLFNLVACALSTVASHPVLPRWMQDLSPEEAAAATAAPSPPRKRSVSSEVRITIAPAPAYAQPALQQRQPKQAAQRQLF
jgi:hypothetical protein